MPMRSRQSLITMSPELLQKLEVASQSLDHGFTAPSVDHANNIVNVLEKRLDSSSDLFQIEPDNGTTTRQPVSPSVSPRQRATENGTVTPDSCSENDTTSSTSDASGDFVCDLFDVSVEVSEKQSSNQSLVSAVAGSGGGGRDDTKRDSLEAPVPVRQRRSSRWSATVLFVASDVQLTVNLAEFSPPDGFQTAPRRGCGDEDDPGDEDEMWERDSDLELRPLDGHSAGNALTKEFSNGGINTSDCDLPPPYENPDNLDNHSLKSTKSKKDEKEEKNRDDRDPNQPPREDWSHKADYLLAVIGYAVDLSNVWRFPYLCYKNGGAEKSLIHGLESRNQPLLGGMRKKEPPILPRWRQHLQMASNGAFIIPYFTVLIFGAMPIFFMEMSLGQFHREGPIGVWKIAPMFRGIGYASCLMAYIVAFYYNVVIGWAFYYLFSTFRVSLPWQTCGNEWNSARCWTNTQGQFNATSNSTHNVTDSVSSAYEFFERNMLRLQLSSGVGDLGGVRWELVACTLLTFTCIYFSLWKGVKSSGKVVYVTATLPYVILTILLIRGCLLPGAVDGIKYFITPNLERLNDPNVWIDAAVQIMFSIGAGFGTHIAYASHNKFNNNCYADCLFTTAVNSFTSIFSGFVVFSYLGYMADRQQKHISHVAQEGPGLVFIVYPEAIATLPGSTAWAVIFFLMLITLGMDSAFGGLESPLTGLGDQFYRLCRKTYSRELLTFLVVGSAFLFSLPCTTWGGMYVFKILDTFAAGTSIIFTVLCQVVVVSWFYGLDNFCADINKMTGHLPGLYWRICWKYLSPTFLIIIVVSSIYHYTPLVYAGGIGRYVYPFYANVIGWMISCSIMSIIPVYCVYYLLKGHGSLKQRISLGISPKWEHKEIQEKKEVRRFQRQHWVYI